LVPGHSGAPILNRQEQVVGIGNGGLDLGRVEMGWAMPWDGIEPQAVSSRVSQTVSWSDYRRLRQLQSSSGELIFVYSTPEPLTITPTATISSTTQAVIDLRVVDEGLTENTYYIEGKQVSAFAIGDDLIVYAEPNPGIEIAVALLKVVGKSATSLTAQAILIDPRYDIRTRLRVDNNLGHLSESQLIPVFAYVEGYLLRPTRIRLRPDHELTVGAQLQALEYERIGGEIIDALRTDTVLQITDIGASNIVAVVELTSGTWPMTGTVVALVEVPTPTQMVTNLPTATTIPNLSATITPTQVNRVRFTVTGVGFAPDSETNPARRKQYALTSARAKASANFALWQAGEEVEEVIITELGVLQADRIRTELPRTNIPGGTIIEQSYDDATGEAQVTVEYLVEMPE
jgi:hypothetical protein